MATALALIVAGNFVLTGKLFISKSGSVFLFARLMQDGIVQQLMDDTCPPRGRHQLAAVRLQEPAAANRPMPGCGASAAAFTPWAALPAQAQQEEDRRIILESLKRYPVMHLRAAIMNSLLQFLQFKTGDGIEPQLSILEPNFQRIIPRPDARPIGRRASSGD